MAKKTPIEQLREAILREAEKPSHERWQALIDRGAIDAEGRVLIRGPETRLPARRRKKP